MRGWIFLNALRVPSSEEYNTNKNTGQRKMKLFSWLAYQFDYSSDSSPSRSSSLLCLAYYLMVGCMPSYSSFNPQTPCHLIPQAGNDSKPSLSYFVRSTEWAVEGVLCLIVFSPTSSPDITRYCNGSFEEMVRKKSILTCRLMVLLWADVDRGCSQKLMYLKCCRYEQEFRNDSGEENTTIFDGRWCNQDDYVSLSTSSLWKIMESF